MFLVSCYMQIFNIFFKGGRGAHLCVCTLIDCPSNDVLIYYAQVVANHSDYDVSANFA